MKAFLHRGIKRLLLAVSAVLVFPAVVTVWLGGSSDMPFLFWGQALSLVPGRIGVFLRHAYYRRTLRRVSGMVHVEFGSFFSKREAEVGQGVYIGSYCILGKVRLGDHCTLASGVHVTSGRRQHGFEKVGAPIQEQGGTFDRIEIGANCWIGECATVLCPLGDNTVVGAGSVVVRPTRGHEVVAGNPAKRLRDLKSEGEES